MLLDRLAIGFAFAALYCGAFAQDDGKYLTILGDCAGCHTKAGGESYAGGRAMISPFGTFYASNITPDRETGIGGWTTDDFWQALHEGRSRNRGRLYPAMPYPHFAMYSRAESDAMFAYLRRVPPVRNVPPENAVRFPLNQRWLMAIWNALYVGKNDYVADPAKSAQWNRGAYLVKGPGHCGDCHTPKNLLYAPRKKLALAGDLVENWWAADLTGDEREGLGTWRASDIVEYLKTGRNQHTMAGGSMAVVIEASTSQDPAAISARPDDKPMPPFAEKMTDGEIADVATYMRNTWGNRAPAASAKQVSDLRKELAAEQR